ncbi:MAG: response regulator [Eubacteriales bacterium]|nr:response regulator [Eubacteriales bacterium]
MKALIVDDDMYVRQCLMQMLPWQVLDFSQVLEAANGMEALEISRREKPELVITDVKMPRMNGLELASRLKREMLDTCVILLSEHNDFSFVHDALQCGADDYILKPLMPAKLEEIAEKIRQKTAEMAMRRYYTGLRSDPASLRTMIREAMHSGDDQSLPDTFEYLAGRMIHRDDLRHFGLMILTEVFEAAEDASPRKAELEALRRDTMSRYAAIRDVEALMGCVREATVCCVRLCDNSMAVSFHVNRMKEYIESNYMDPDLSVAKVSENVHLSPIYTGALFKKHMGRSIVSYIHEVRIEQAKRLLADGTISVKEISNRIGYVAPDYFSRLFSKAVGVKPSRYRAIIQEEAGRNEEETQA